MTSNMLKSSWISALSMAFVLMGAGITSAQIAGSAERGQPQTAADDEADAPKVIAIKFHADWCGSCKQMGDVFEEMKAKFDQQPVLWINLDLTREHGRKQAEFLMSALGMSQVWAEHGGKTGFILLANPQNRQVVARLGADESLAGMGEKLLEAVQRLSE